ncbi:MAG: DUF2442 domain-containing protein [Acidobacteria bacterium]|nr:DUF2442 domain-containing protein [Acidobacteriota bacterium]
MPTLVAGSEAVAIDVSCSNDALTVVLDDGRIVSVPLVWFPRLLNATEKQKKEWEFIGGGIGIHWEETDEDIIPRVILVGGLPGSGKTPYLEGLRRPADRKRSSAKPAAASRISGTIPSNTPAAKFATRTASLPAMAWSTIAPCARRKPSPPSRENIPLLETEGWLRPQ